LDRSRREHSTNLNDHFIGLVSRQQLAPCTELLLFHQATASSTPLATAIPKEELNMSGDTPNAEGLAYKKGLQKSVVAGSIGVLVHWFDWAVYAYMATTIAAIFFPEEDSTAGLLATFAVFAVSFLVRPIGAIIFGRLGDKLGRKHTLSLVILAMALSTLVLGVLPTYSTIGVLALHPPHPHSGRPRPCRRRRIR
jgi:hypothetical protein